MIALVLAVSDSTVRRRLSGLLKKAISEASAQTSNHISEPVDLGTDRPKILE